MQQSELGHLRRDRSGPSTATFKTAELCALGSAVWGPEWQEAMAAELNISLRTVHRWADGRRWPGVEMTAIICNLARDEAKELRERAEKIARLIDDVA